MAKTLRKYFDKTLLGTVDGKKIYLTAPSWDCGWYWGFGYLGNCNCHYHVDGLKCIEKWVKGSDGNNYQTIENVNLHEGFIRHFDEGSFIVKDDKDIWTLAELFETFYRLKGIAEVYGRGGSHYTTNPCAELIKNEVEVNRINEELLPAIFEEIYKILDKYTYKYSK